MREAVGPYTRFVRVEREKLEQMAGSMEEARQELAKLRAGVNSAVPARKMWPERCASVLPGEIEA